MDSTHNSRKSHFDDSADLSSPAKTTINESELITLLEDSRSDLEKILAGFKDQNKLTSVQEYLAQKSDDFSHLTMEIRTLEKIKRTKKGRLFHHIYKIHLNAINIPAYLYLVHPNEEIITEREIYVLKNVNCVIQNSNLFVKTNDRTEVILLNEDTMSVGEIEDRTNDFNEASFQNIHNLILKKPFDQWRECRKTLFRNYQDMLGLLTQHVDLKDLIQVKHLLIKVIPSIIQPSSRPQSKLQSKNFNMYNKESIELRLKDTKESFIGIIKEIYRVR